MATQQTNKAASAAKPAAAATLANTDVESSHPAVDEDPRAGTTTDQNRIDFNDPTIDGRKAVAQNLAAQAK